MTDAIKVIAEKFKERKVAIAYPSPELIHVDFVNDLTNLINNTSQYVKLGLTNAVSSRVSMNRNTLVSHCRYLGATDILWIDADTKFPVNGLMRLLMHDKDIVCATTSRRKGVSREPIGVPMDIKSISPYQKLVKMSHIGFPFMLTSMKVFDKIDELGLAPNRSYFAEPPRWMMEKIGDPLHGIEELVGEDEYWCHLVLKAGFDIWCDMELSMEIGHIGWNCYYIEQSNAEGASLKVDEELK